MPWFSKVGDEVKEHDQKLWAIFACKVAVSMGTSKVEDCAIYKRNPAKYPDEPNLLPAMIEKERQKRLAEQIRSIMGKGKRKQAIALIEREGNGMNTLIRNDNSQTKRLAHHGSAKPITRADYRELAKALGKRGGSKRWALASTNGKASPSWREMSRRGGKARAVIFEKERALRAYRRAKRKGVVTTIDPSLVAAMTEAILELWQTMTVAEIADRLCIHNDTVRKRVRIARRNGDARAFSKRPDLVK